MSPSGEPILFWTLCYLWVLNVADLALTNYGIWLGFAINRFRCRHGRAFRQIIGCFDM
jgi:hypothetical protein